MHLAIRIQIFLTKRFAMICILSVVFKLRRKYVSPTLLGPRNFIGQLHTNRAQLPRVRKDHCLLPLHLQLLVNKNLRRICFEAKKFGFPLHSEYVYAPTDSQVEIRILELFPPNPRDPTKLHGQLVRKTVDSLPKYEALSYAWGESVRPDTIQLATGRMRITENLASALRELRYCDRSRRLWVDAICVNQQDSNEKGHQVALMSKVYRNARSGLVWLGEDNNSTREAISYLRRLANLSKELGVYMYHPLPSHIDSLRKETTHEALKCLANSINTEALHAFFNQPWFRRLWVVQEFILATAPVFHNGQDEISANDFTAAMKTLELLSKHPITMQKLPLEQFRTAVSLVNDRFAYGWSQQISFGPLILRNVMATHSGREHENDLDLVYGFVGLIVLGI